jgi:transposase-like protein
MGGVRVTQDDVLFGYRLRLFALAGEVGVSQACRLMGVHRSTYYRWKGQVERQGLEMLRPRERRSPQMPNQIPQIVEERIVAFSLGEGCQNPVSSCCGEVLVEESAESVASLDSCLPRWWRWRLGRDRRLAAERAMWSLGVVMVDVDAQDAVEVARPRISSQSRHSVRAVRTKRSACALACGTRNGVWMTVVPSVRKTSSKPATNFVSRSRIRNLTLSSAPERLRLRACWVTQRPPGSR